MKKILILSDTHNLLREEIQAECRAADIILHAGDITSPTLLENLRVCGTLYAVSGNNDAALVNDLPMRRTITIEGVSFLIVHDRRDVPPDCGNVDIVIYGHSHRYDAQKIGETLFLNPGSCGMRRFGSEITFCRMTIEGDAYHYEKVTLPL